MDWVAWHADYEDPDSRISRPLVIVQKHIRAFLDGFSGSPVHVVSMCAGEARDLLGVIGAVERRDISGRLVELDPRLATIARQRCIDLGLHEIEVVEADAGHSSVYAGAVPADLVLDCGVFGNVSEADIERTVRHTPQLCAAGAMVIWTRHRGEPDITPPIRRWYAESDFEELAFEPVPETEASVGVMAYRGPTVPLTDQTLFVFNRTA